MDIPPRGLCHRSDMGLHLRIYQGTDAQRALAGADIHAALPHRLCDDARRVSLTAVGRLVARRTQDDAARHQRRFALLPQRKRGDELYLDHQYLAHRVLVPALCHAAGEAGLPFHHAHQHDAVGRFAARLCRHGHRGLLRAEPGYRRPYYLIIYSTPRSPPPPCSPSPW